jgi:hypothetical protein
MKRVSVVVLLNLLMAGSAVAADAYAYRIPKQGLQASLLTPVLSMLSLEAVQVNAPAFSINLTSTSPAAFTFSSSNPAVASVSGSVVTPVAPGSSTITATQIASGRYAATSVSAVLLVTPLPTPLGAFSIPAKQAGDAAFALTPPSSPSTGAFTYTSSNPLVASINGDVVTPLTQGTTTITASQAAAGTYVAAVTSTTLSVGAALPSNFVVSGGFTWSAPTGPLNYSAAVAKCASTINGQTGWRMPTQAELAALYANRVAAAYAAKGWPVSTTKQPYGLMRGSDFDPNAGPGSYHKGYYLGIGGNVSQPDTNAVYEGYVTCVHT